MLKSMCTYNITLDDRLVAEAEGKLKVDDSFPQWLQREVEAMVKEYVGKPLSETRRVVRVKKLPVDRPDAELCAEFAGRPMPDIPAGDASWQDIGTT